MKVDICIVTKNQKRSIPGLEKAPVNNLMIETSTPLGLARMRAIRKVKTEWFAFVDDDVSLFPSWFDVLSDHLDPEIGAVSGYLQDCGFGPEIDKHLKERPIELKSYQIGERWCGTHHGLIRTAIVQDWEPSRKDVSSWEDYEITQHILKKGYKVLQIPVYLGKHQKGVLKIIKNVMWNFEGQLVEKGSLSVANTVFRSLFQVIHLSLLPGYPLKIRMFYVFPRYVQFFCIWRLIFRSIASLVKKKKTYDASLDSNVST